MSTEPSAPIAPAAPIVYTLSRRFVLLSLKRAFRLNIDIGEVLPSERRALELGASHVTHPEHQAFLAWRRSVLLLIALIFVPLTVFRFMEAFDGPRVPDAARTMLLLPAFAEAIFCMVAFYQLRNWTKWQTQRRALFWAWAIYFLAPFFLYLYPFRAAFDGQIALARQAAEIAGVKLNASRSQIHMVVGMAFGVQSVLVLAPKIISLMPGVIRASIVTKLIFPGSSVPGWLMVLAAPMYALFAYAIVLLPYQITGSVYFVAGNLGIMAAQFFIGWSGRQFTLPLTHADANTRIHKAWMAYIGLLLLGGGMMVVGLYDVLTQLNYGTVRVISAVLAFMGNVLVMTLIGTDVIIANMQRLQRTAPPTAAEATYREESAAKLEQFCQGDGL
ncbi:MAG: hypothetical protein IPL79_11035 [Myxococcales bacterium]|nr:hypothetical protein [Myxococcales bacterium]